MHRFWIHCRRKQSKIVLRFGSFIINPVQICERRIWITFDRLYKGGDNGEYAFREINAIRGKVEIYYILREDAPEYAQMKRPVRMLWHMAVWNQNCCHYLQR